MSNEVINKAPTAQKESLPELLKQLTKSSAKLIHNETELVIQRIREKVRVIGGGILVVAAGSAMIFAAILSLCTALIIELNFYMSAVIAALVVGVALIIVGAAVVFIGYRQLKSSNTEKED